MILTFDNSFKLFLCVSKLLNCLNCFFFVCSIFGTCSSRTGGGCLFMDPNNLCQLFFFSLLFIGSWGVDLELPRGIHHP